MATAADEQEMRRLMDAYGDALLGACCLLLRDYQQAQDVVQETFIKAWKQGGLIRETERAWLLRVAVNRCRDVQRKPWMRLIDRRFPVDEMSIPVQTRFPESDLLKHVYRLPRSEREVIVMHYFSDMPPETIARMLRISRATVYRRLNRGRKRLKIELEGEEDRE